MFNWRNLQVFRTFTTVSQLVKKTAKFTLMRPTHHWPLGRVVGTDLHNESFVAESWWDANLTHVVSAVDEVLYSVIHTLQSSKQVPKSHLSREM